MKKSRTIIAAATALVLLCTGCSNNNSTKTAGSTTTTTAAVTTEAATSAETTEPETEAPAEDDQPENGIYADFSKGESELFEKSHGWCNGDPFNVTWKKTNVTFEDGKMQLIIDKDPIGTKVPYAGGEYRSLGFYGYGRYEVSMKAIKNDGVVSSYFTYTGPSDNNPWDEIDIEILGKDTTKVQFNYYTNGRGGHEYMYDLGFDASEDFHTYAFEWYEDRIVWYVDGKEAYTATKNLPSTPGKIMANAWCGIGVDGWLNAFTDENIPLTAEYQWMKYTEFES